MQRPNIRSICAAIWLVSATGYAQSTENENQRAAVRRQTFAQHAAARSHLNAVGDKKTLDVPEDPARRGVFVVCPAAHLDRSYFGATRATRFLVARLRVVNLTPETVGFETKSIVLDADGTSIPHTPLTPNLRVSGFTMDGQNVRTRTIKSPPSVEIEPGHVANLWISFLNLPDVARFSKLILTFKDTNPPIEFDLLGQWEHNLKLSSELIGPRNALGLLTVKGPLDTVSAHVLVRQLEQLAGRGVDRAVLRFAKDAPPLHYAAQTWLTQSTMHSASASSRYPLIPATIAEFHLSRVPGKLRTTTSSRLHLSDSAAVAAALRSAYERISIDELLAEIRRGRPLAREAAILGGGDRLPPEHLPELIELSRNDDKHLSGAAIASLAAFSIPAATARLREAVTDPDPEIVQAAVRGLANSRFPAARRELLDALKTTDGKHRAAIAQVLMGDPRPEFAELFLEYASDPASTLSHPALRALNQVGHSQLMPLLKRILAEGKPTLRAEAMRILKEGDAASRAIAVEHIMQVLRKGDAPGTDMLNLLEVTGHTAAVPLLMEYFKSQKRGRRQPVLTTISRIGDDAVVPFLLEQYPKLDDREKTIALRALQVFEPKELRQIAVDGLRSDYGNLVNTATAILQADGSDEAIEAIGAAIFETKQDSTAHYMIRALGQLGTPKAMIFLRQLQNGESRTRRQYAGNVLDDMIGSTPARTLLIKASALSDAKKIKEADAKYTEAVTVDPFCPQAWVSRGHLRVHNQRVAEGLKDFESALKLDPLNPVATSLKAITVVVNEDIEKGLAQIEDNRTAFRYDSLFHYNAACTYGQAILNTKATADNAATISKWKTRSLDALERSIQLGHDDLELMTNDPDLVPIKNTDRFKAMVNDLKRKLPPREDKG